MKAVTWRKYGPPERLKVEEIGKPVPQEDQLLVKVHAASINAKEYRLLDGRPFLLRLMIGGLLKPKNTRLGTDAAGRVEAVGEKVKRFRPGDEVFGCCDGAFAGYACAREGAWARKPASVSFEQAAAVPVAALTALQGLRDSGKIRAGQKVLIQGASGGVGSFAVQLAKSFGAEVTAVCSPRNLETARTMGADHVIDYTRENFTRGERRYDLIYAANGYHSLFEYRRALAPRGLYVCAGGTLPQIFQSMLIGPLLSRRGRKELRSMGVAKIKQEDLTFLAELLQAGKIVPVIDRSYPMSEIVDAFRYVVDTHPRGKVVITVGPDDA